MAETTPDIDKYFASINFTPMFMLEKSAFSSMFKVSIPTIDGKIRDKKWVQGKEFIRDPDGKVHILIFGYQKWVISQWQENGNKVELPPLEASLYSGSGGIIQTKAQPKNTDGRSPHVKRIMKIVDRS